MSAATLSPPRPPVCLEQSSASRGIKGGTVIAEDVLDRQSHVKRLVDPDGYRREVWPCRRCGSKHVHAHMFRERGLRPASPEEVPEIVTIRLYRCAAEACGAVFTVLPAFVARHLWRSWETVQKVSTGETLAPKTTRRRWLARLASDASRLVQSFMSLAAEEVRGQLSRQRPQSRRSFVEALESFVEPTTEAFALAAAWIHRLEPGVRLM